LAVGRDPCLRFEIKTGIGGQCIRAKGQGRIFQRPSTTDYNLRMLDETDFRKRADSALESLKKSLMLAEESSDIEVEDQSGALHVSFEDGSKFVISPNAAVRQIWISALATSFKLDWSDPAQDFVLAKSGEKLKPLVTRLINQQLGEELVALE